jgi:hypothetical protein
MTAQIVQGNKSALSREPMLPDCSCVDESLERMHRAETRLGLGGKFYSAILSASEYRYGLHKSL